MIWISLLFSCASDAEKMGTRYGEIFCESRALKEIIIMADEHKSQYLSYSDQLEEENEQILEQKDKLSDSQLAEFNTGIVKAIGKGPDEMHKASCELGLFSNITIFGQQYKLFFF